MAKGLITYQTLSDIADAIRTKLETQDTYKPSEMAEAVMSISGGGSSVTIVPFASGTDEEIVAMIQAAHAGTIDLQQDGEWAVGDTRTINISAFSAGGVSEAQQDIDIVITSFAEYMSCGNVLQFDFKQSLSTAAPIHTSRTNNGGYGITNMKTTVLPALINALPTWLKDALIEFSCLSSAGNNSSSIVTVTGNKLALRSEVEVFNNTNNSYAGEGIYVPYYASSGQRSKAYGKGGGTMPVWLRSPSKTTYGFACISYDGSYSTSGGYADSNSYGIAPFGCL